MDIQISDNWLREFLKTKATAKQISNCLSLCGPSVEKVSRGPYGPVYSIEVTTNHVDTASVYGIAREATAILPRFKIKATLQSIKLAELNLVRGVKYLHAKVDDKLCPRFTAVLIKNVKIKDSPSWMKERLLAVGVRPINNVVDISNYIMHEIGQPVHTFDYDKIEGHKMYLRESKKREKITTLDGKTHKLAGGDIVIEDGKGRLIDLAGIMGAENSAVDKDTRNVLLFVQTYNPVNIRKTSMSLAHRTEAAVLFEKGLDPELVALGVAGGIELFEKLADGKAEKQILDLYPNPYKTKKVETDINFITQRLGVALSKSEISKTLSALGFSPLWKGKSLSVSVPSFRANDIEIPEDIVEEVARIFGYHNLPSELMQGAIPDQLIDAPFNFERKVKNILKGSGGIEVYTLSLVSKEEIEGNALRLKNPLGADSEYLRTSLMPSLIKSAKENKGEKDHFHLFEMANTYLPRRGNLPEERMILSGILSSYQYREAKGIVENLLEELNINFDSNPEDEKDFLPNQRIVYRNDKTYYLGHFGVLDNGYIYYEFEIEVLRKGSLTASFKTIPKYPAQIEDITLTFPAKTKVGEVIESMEKIDKLISNVELRDIYKDSYTFRIWYQHPSKTLTDKEVEKVRYKVLAVVKTKFGANLRN